MSWLGRLFVWWRDATPGTFVTTRYSGQRVGEDSFGNRYFQTKDSKRRWVIYAGTVEASRVPPEWHGWLHHTFDKPPTLEPLKTQPWETPHEPNLTGTKQAYHPEGSLWGEGKRPPVRGQVGSSPEPVHPVLVGLDAAGGRGQPSSQGSATLDVPLVP